MTTTPFEEATDDAAAARKALLERRLRGRLGGRDREGRSGSAQQPATVPSTIGPRPAGPPPLSYQQERIWLAEQVAGGSCAYTVAIRMRLHGPLDQDALRGALDDLPARHDALRMRFVLDDEGRPAVQLVDRAEVPLRLTEAADEPAAQELVAAAVAAPFDLARGPLLRALLIRLADAEHVLLLTTHHIVADGWSVDLLQRDLAAAYHVRRAGAVPAAAPAGTPSYGDFAHWQRTTLTGPALDRTLQHWIDQVGGVEPLELVTDRPRPAVSTFGGGVHRFQLDRDLADGITALAREHGATLFMALLAAYQVLLARHARQHAFAVGTAVAGRSHAELEEVVGMFVNMLPVPAALDDDPTFATLLDRVRHRMVAALDHQDLPFERLVRAMGIAPDPGRSPVFQATFVLQNYEMGRMAAAGTSDLQFHWEPMEVPAARSDLELKMVPLADGVLGELVYSTDLYTADTAAALCDHLAELLRAAVVTPDTPVSALAMADAQEHARIAGWNATAADFPDSVTLTELVEAQVASTPDAPAVIVAGEQRCMLTYRQLDENANRVANRLREHGVGSGTPVAVCVPRSAELVVTLLGVLKAGGAYVPLDPDYPAERLAFMLTDSQAPVLVALTQVRDLLPEVPAVVLLADDPAEWVDRPTTRPEPLAGPADPAYVIYTSGSTGKPKGVPNSHRGVVNRLDWMQRRYGIGEDDAVLQKTPAGFDVSVWEFFWPLITGARLVLAEPGGHRDPAYLFDVLAEERITTVHFVPSMLTVFLTEPVDAGPTDMQARLPALRRVLCSGEELSVATARTFLDLLPDVELHNLYGPTEAAIDVTAWQCTREELDGVARVPLGTPIQNIRIHVLDAAGRPVPTGVPGELVIAGVGVALGYHDRPELTAERFVPDPDVAGGRRPGEGRAYRSGDLARWRPDGVLEFLGRLDDQVKIRGVRIELGEVAAAVRAHPDVRDAAVVVREDRPGDKRLTAYVVGDVDRADLRAELRRTLPEYMLPAAVVPVDVLPLTPNGKLDRRALPSPTAALQTARPAGEVVEPRTDLERLLAALWREVLSLPAEQPLGITEDFFELGGHSLLATRLVALLRRAAPEHRPVGVMDLLAQRTVAELAAFMTSVADDGPARLLHELTPPIPAGQRTITYVCFPYGGGSAIVYQPLADALPPGHALLSVAIPGHDVGRTEAALPFGELVARIGAEIIERVDGPIALYGHCGVGNAITFGVARHLQEHGRDIEAVCNGAIFPFARLGGGVGRLSSRLDSWRSNRHYASWLKGMGVDTDVVAPEQADVIITNMRADSRAAEEYFTELLEQRVERLPAPVISIVGSEDPVTDYYTERYREWGFLTGTTALVVLDRAGHFFLRHRAEELAEVLTRVLPAVVTGDTRELPGPESGSSWALHGVHTTQEIARETADAEVPGPSVGRFVAVTAGQLISTTSSTLVGFAVPIWLYLQTGSVTDLGLLWSLSLLCGVLTLPVAGALIDRGDRRKMMMLASCTSGAVELTLAVLLWSGAVHLWNIYLLLALSAVATSFQRVAFQSAVPQLVPKRYLGNAMGIVAAGNGVAMMIMPLLAAGLLSTIGLAGLIVTAVCGYALAVLTLLAVRFPDLLGWRPREPLVTALANGLRYSWNHRGFRLMLGYFALANVFLGPALVLMSPLVLSFAGIAQVGQVALAEAAGAVAGGVLMAVWGGPRRRRMVTVLFGNAGMAAGCLIAGLRPSLVVVMTGMFVLGACMALSQSVYATIVQVKVPQRYHGRVFAINQAITWSTLPIGFAVLAPVATALFEPLLDPGGPLAGSVGTVLGVGDGRGIGLAYVVFALIMGSINLGALALPRLRRFDTEVPDTLPDDLVGLQERQLKEQRLKAATA